MSSLCYACLCLIICWLVLSMITSPLSSLFCFLIFCFGVLVLSHLLAGCILLLEGAKVGLHGSHHFFYVLDWHGSGEISPNSFLFSLFCFVPRSRVRFMFASEYCSLFWLFLLLFSFLFLLKSSNGARFTPRERRPALCLGGRAFNSRTSYRPHTWNLFHTKFYFSCCSSMFSFSFSFP